MLTRVLRTASIDSIDGRSHLGVALRRVRDDLTAQLGEPSAAERILIEEAAKARVIAAAVGDYVLRQATLVDGQTLLPVVDAHARLVDRLAKLLATLGLRPREKPVPSLRSTSRQRRPGRAALRAADRPPGGLENYRRQESRSMGGGCQVTRGLRTQSQRLARLVSVLGWTVRQHRLPR
jgi:hypothetical protein